MANETPEVILAAAILLQLKEDYRKQSPKEDDIDDEVASTPSIQVISQAHQKQSRKRKEADKNQPNKVKKQKMIDICMEEAFSEETRRLIREWYETEPDQPEIFGDAEVTREFSKLIKKQLTSSDVDKIQSRLMLSKQVKETMLLFLEESEIPREGLDVSVYGPDGEVHKMKFKIWNGEKTPVLTSGWNEFVANYGLMMITDFITVWMFKHIKSQKICFAIDWFSFPLKELG